MKFIVLNWLNINHMKHRLSLIIMTLVIIQITTSCSLSMDSFSRNLNKAVMSNNDPQTVSQALPAYLILMDGLIEDDPEDEIVLKASAELMTAYAGLLGSQVELMSGQPENSIQVIRNQQKKLNEKALDRINRAICIYEEKYCNLTDITFSEFKVRLRNVNIDDIDMLYSLGTIWASWLQGNTDDWNAMAKLPQIKLLMEKTVMLDEHWKHAGGHMYLGVLNSFIPASLGGRPNIGKDHFETAIKLTEGKNLMVKVLYAEFYSRLMFDEELHKTLINDVLTTENTPIELNLINTLARQKAKALKVSAADYF